MEYLQLCGMPTGNAYPSGYLVTSLFWGHAYAQIVETSFSEFAVSFLDFSPGMPLGTFSSFRWYQDKKISLKSDRLRL